MRQGDVSRRRRLKGEPAKLRYYARYRTVRFARRFFGRSVATTQEKAVSSDKP